MKKALFVLIPIISVFILCACSQKTAEEATADLKDSLYVGFELIEEKTDGDESLYTFRDEKGTEFHYESRLIRALSFTTLFARTESHTDYSREYVISCKDQTEAILEKSGLKYVFDTDDYCVIKLYAETRADVDTAANTVADIINAVGVIPIDSGANCFIPSYIEVISYGEKCCQSFLYKDADSFDAEYLHMTILTAYVNAARNGEPAQNDVTDSDYVTCPAERMYISYEDREIGGVYFSYLAGEYYIDFYDIMPSKSHIVDDFSFAETCGKMGIPCESTVTGLKWTIGENEYRSEYSKKHKVMKIYKNNEEICTLPCEALEMSEQSYVVTASPDNLAEMIDCKYKIDYKLGRIYFNAN